MAQLEQVQKMIALTCIVQRKTTFLQNKKNVSYLSPFLLWVVPELSVFQ